LVQLIGKRPFDKQTTYEEFVYGAEGLPTNPNPDQAKPAESEQQPKKDE